MTVHNSNLQMDGDDQDSSTVIIGYCPDMFPAFKNNAIQLFLTPFIGIFQPNHLLGVVAISWCPHDSSYLLTCAKDDRTILWDTNSAEIASELTGGTNSNFDEHWPMASKVTWGHISILVSWKNCCDDLNLDWSWLCKKTSNEGLKSFLTNVVCKRDFGSLLLVGKFNMVVPLLSRNLKVGASWRLDVTRFWSYYGTHSNKERAIANLAMNVMLKSIFLQSLPLLSHPPRCPNTRGASGNGEKPTQHIDGGGANVKLHSAGLSLASTTNGTIK
ncbi:transport protein Sec31 homolog B-like protein [Tanacetum coccineum]